MSSPVQTVFRELKDKLEAAWVEAAWVQSEKVEGTSLAGPRHPACTLICVNSQQSWVEMSRSYNRNHPSSTCLESPWVGEQGGSLFCNLVSHVVQTL